MFSWGEVRARVCGRRGAVGKQPGKTPTNGMDTAEVPKADLESNVPSELHTRRALEADNVDDWDWEPRGWRVSATCWVKCKLEAILPPAHTDLCTDTRWFSFTINFHSARFCLSCVFMSSLSSCDLHSSLFSSLQQTDVGIHYLTVYITSDAEFELFLEPQWLLPRSPIWYDSSLFQY